MENRKGGYTRERSMGGKDEAPSNSQKSSNDKAVQEERDAIKVICQNEIIPFTYFVNQQYTASWVHEEIAAKLEAVEKGEIKRLMLFVPPRHGKSELSSIIFPAWYIGKHPEHEVIVASYSAELAEDFGYKTRAMVNDAEYKEIFNARLRQDSKSRAKWLTMEGGGYTASGVGGAITGRGANLLIIDDPVKNREDAESEVIRDKTYSWYTSTAYTRLEKDGKVILIMTRWHMDDLAGRLLKDQEEGGDKWEVIKFPAVATHDEAHRKQGDALWPEKYSYKDLIGIKNTVGSYDWSALYQQSPVAAEEQEFRPEFYQYRTWDELYKMKTRRFLTIDTAISKGAKSDYTGYCLNYVDQNNKWNIKAWRAKESPTELIDNIFALWQEHRLDAVGIEKTIYLQAIKPFLDEEMRVRNKFPHIIELKHQQVQKETRIRGILPRYESHSVFHLRNECRDLEEEQMNFPKGTHDDVLDALAYQSQIANAPSRPSRKQKTPLLQKIKLRMTNY